MIGVIDREHSGGRQQAQRAWRAADRRCYHGGSRAWYGQPSAEGRRA